MRAKFGGGAGGMGGGSMGGVGSSSSRGSSGGMGGVGSSSSYNPATGRYEDEGGGLDGIMTGIGGMLGGIGNMVGNAAAVAKAKAEEAQLGKKGEAFGGGEVEGKYKGTMKTHNIQLTL